MFNSMNEVSAPKFKSCTIASIETVTATISVTIPTKIVALNGVLYCGWILPKTPENGSSLSPVLCLCHYGVGQFSVVGFGMAHLCDDARSKREQWNDQPCRRCDLPLLEDQIRQLILESPQGQIRLLQIDATTDKFSGNIVDQCNFV